MTDAEHLAGLGELYERLRGQVEHENDLYNQRIIWLITMQAFLYATMGLMVQADVQTSSEAHDVRISLLMALVCAVGCLVALIADRLLRGATAAVRAMGERWDQAIATAPLEMRWRFPHVSGGDARLPPLGPLLRSGNLPKVFALSWLVAAAINFSETVTAWAQAGLQCFR